MKIHICLYRNGQEVVNINDVICLLFYCDHLVITALYFEYNFTFAEFDKIEVNYYD